MMNLARPLLALLLLAAAPVRAQSPAPSAAPMPPTTVPLGEIASRSQVAGVALSGIEPTGQPDATLATTRAVLPELGERIGLLMAENARPSTALETLHERAAAWQKLGETLNARADLLYQRTKGFDADDAQITEARALWQATDKATTAAKAPPDTLAAVRGVLAAAEAAGGRVKGNRNAVLALQSRLGEMQGKVRTALLVIEAAQANAVRTLWARDSPPLWATAAGLDAATLAENGRAVAAQRVALSDYLRLNWHLFALHGLLFLVLYGLFCWLRRLVRRWTDAKTHLQRELPIFAVPAAAALVLSFFIKGAAYIEAPSLLRAVLGAVVLVPTIIILRRLLDRRIHRVPSALVAFYFLDQVQVATAAFPRLSRLIFAGQMLAAGLGFAWLAMTARSLLQDSTATEIAPAQRTAARWMQPLFWLASVITFSALLAGIFGYARLASLLGVATLRSSYFAVVFFALYSILGGLLFVVWRVRPAAHLRIIREHRETVERKINGLLALLAFGFWGWEMLAFFGVRHGVVAAVGAFLDRPFGAGALSLTAGHLLGFFLAIWLSILLSRGVRFFLDEEIYQRMKLAPGLPYAISAVVNYSVLLVGFLIALGLLGVDLTKVTIIVSAFSVGLGFGLQNVINNFVSGIILLFERPVRVGDIIQIAEATGEVRRIGIRASIIRLPDGADLIVPNGNLISNPVTNWTYSDRARAVEIALTVDAIPADSERVLELLRQVVNAQDSTPDNLKAPQVFITGLTAGKLNITVRAWASVYEDSTRLRSDLSAAIFTALAREKIGLV